jgi:hypothetical protein
MEKEDYEFFSSRISGLTVEGVPDLNAGTIPSVGGSTSEIAAQGYFALANVDYQGRYIADALVRRDGSSLFGPEERWHTYYRGSAAWRMAEEAWWPVAAINEFKLRYSVGTAGGRPSYGDRFETYSFTDGGGLVKSTLGNRFLKPERATEHEMGIDAIIRDRVSVQLTHARVKTEDQLTLVPLAAGFGFSSQWQNAGTVEGNTWEATIEAGVIERPGLRWSLGSGRGPFAARDHGIRPPLLPYRHRQRLLPLRRRDAGHHVRNPVPPDLSELPEGLPASQFQVNDDGLVVWVGEGGDWRNASVGHLFLRPRRHLRLGPFRSWSSTRGQLRRGGASARATRTSTGDLVQPAVGRPERLRPAECAGGRRHLQPHQPADVPVLPQR